MSKKINKEVEVTLTVNKGKLANEFTVRWEPSESKNNESFAYTFMTESSFLDTAEAFRQAMKMYKKHIKENDSKEI